MNKIAGASGMALVKENKKHSRFPAYGLRGNPNCASWVNTR